MGERSQMKYCTIKNSTSLKKKTVDKFSLILVPISASWVSSLSSDVCVFRFCAQTNYKNRSFDKQGKDIGHEVVV